MSFFIPENSLQYGFRIKAGGAHASKTMMLREVRLLFAASTPLTEFEELQRLVVEENVLLKDTLANREDVFQRLTDLYGLRQEIRFYRALRALWDTEEQEQPVLALLCAIARDSLLRVTAPTVLNQPIGALVETKLVEDALEAALPLKYRPTTRLSVSQNITATWVQSGHLTVKPQRLRQRPFVGPASAAYALLLAYLCDARGILLFETDWVKVLDTVSGRADSLAVAASQRGWVDYRRIGNVVDIGFSYLMQV